MFKLIKLELKKYKIGGFIKGAIIATSIISLFFIYSMYITFKTHDMSLFNNYNEMAKIFVRCVFTIFASVLISNFVIDEYTGKTINLLFMYPIKRKDIMVAKLIVIVMFTFISMVASNIFIHFILFIFNIFTRCIDGKLIIYMGFGSFLSIISDSILFSFISLIPLYVGMKRRKNSSVIVTGIIVTSLLNSGTGDLRLSSFVIIPCIGAVIGILSSYLAIRNVENDDVVN